MKFNNPDMNDAVEMFRQVSEIKIDEQASFKVTVALRDQLVDRYGVDLGEYIVACIDIDVDNDIMATFPNHVDSCIDHTVVLLMNTVDALRRVYTTDEPIKRALRNQNISFELTR